MMEMGRVTDVKNSIKWSEVLLEKIYGYLQIKQKKTQILEKHYKQILI